MGRNFFNSFKRTFESARHKVADVTHIHKTSDVLPHIPFTHSSTFPLPPIGAIPLVFGGGADLLNPFTIATTVESVIGAGKEVRDVIKDPVKRKKVGKNLELAAGLCGLAAAAQPELLPICIGLDVGGIALDASGKAHDSLQSGDVVGAVKEVAKGVGKLSGKMSQVLSEEEREELQLEKIGSVAKKIEQGADKTNELLGKMLKLEKEENKREQIADKSHNHNLQALISNTKTQIEHDIQQDQVLDDELQAQQKNIEKEEEIIESQQESISQLINEVGKNNNNQISNTGNQALDFVLNNIERFNNLPRKQKNRILDKLINSGALDSFL